MSSRRQFIQRTAKSMAAGLLMESMLPQAFGAFGKDRIKKVKVNGHLWVYASKFPPKWDCTPNLETVFADFSYAGVDGVELMESTLRHDDSVSRINGFIDKYHVPVSGSSYGVGFNMWDKKQHAAILTDIKLILPRLKQVKGSTFGISVGDAGRLKTEAELDDQAAILQQILAVCQDNGIAANLHNHTYEVAHDLHDVKGTMLRLPKIMLGPDLNWLIRAGVDPVNFIDTYGDKIVYLHLRDQYTDGRWTEYLGQGDTDFPAIAAALKRKNFKGNVAMELAFPENYVPVNNLKDDWKMSRAFVKKTFGW